MALKSDQARFYLNAGFNEVAGWLNPYFLHVLDCVVTLMNEFDHEWHDVLEIGVHEGKLFIPLERIAPDERSVVGVDLFDLQRFNIDRSGRGSLQRFTKNINNYCRLPDRVVIEKSDSFDLVHSRIAQRRLSVVSVDGGHTVEHVVSDLAFVSQRLAAGGVVYLDDFGNPGWLGVMEGLIRYLDGVNTRLAPVGIGFNKLILTTVSYQKHYFDRLGVLSHHFGLGTREPTRLCGWPVQVLIKPTAN